MEKQVNWSERTRERFLEILSNNELNYTDELIIFQAIADKYKLMTVADYAKHVNKAYNTVCAMIKSESIPVITINEKQFILCAS